MWSREFKDGSLVGGPLTDMSYPAQDMHLLWEGTLRRIANACLGREFTNADADRFQLVRASDPQWMGVIFDGKQAAEMKGAFDTRQEGTFYRVDVQMADGMAMPDLS